MLKLKTLVVALLITLGFSSLMIGSVNASTTTETVQLKSSVLNWTIFTTSQSTTNKGKTLDCNSADIKPYLDSSEKRDELFSEGGDKNNISLDVKGCVMEGKVNQFATWFIYLGIIVLIAKMIFLGVQLSMGSDEGGGHGGGGMPGSGGGGEIGEKLKGPAYGLLILVVILVGGLNAIMIFLKFFVDLFIK